MTTSTSAPQRLYLMQVAHLPVSPADFPFVCYLVQTGDGKNILIDSGPPTHFKPNAAFKLPDPIMEKNVIEQLALLGLQPGDIDTLICSHFDQDHSGHHSAFTNAELARSSDHMRFTTTRSEWDHPALRYRLIDGDTELYPGLELIKTSGHTPGHQSVLVRLSETGPVLLAIDAVASQKDFTPDRQKNPVADDNEEELRASTRKLLALVEREQVALVIFGHDGEQWQTLKKAPDFYS